MLHAPCRTQKLQNCVCVLCEWLEHREIYLFMCRRMFMRSITDKRARARAHIARLLARYRISSMCLCSVASSYKRVCAREYAIIVLSSFLCEIVHATRYGFSVLYATIVIIQCNYEVLCYALGTARAHPTWLPHCWESNYYHV